MREGRFGVQERELLLFELFAERDELLFELAAEDLEVERAALRG